jgi:hypothetical protein
MNRFVSGALCSAAVLCLLVWGLHYASFDLWGDEIISLKDYALLGLGATATTYIDPNNHILFNLLNGLLAGVVGSQDLFDAMDQVAFFRWTQWVLALGTCVYVYLTGKRFVSEMAGVLSLVCLVTCLPFLNFSMQLRGYGLSMFLAAVLVYHTWAAESSETRKHLVLVFFSAFGILYTVPSNAYLVLAVAVLATWSLFRRRRTSETSGSLWAQRESWILLALGFGGVAALVAYSPVLADVFNNRFFQASPDSRWFILAQQLPQVAFQLVSFRYLIVPMAAVGFFFAFRRADQGSPSRGRGGCLAGLLLLPFLFSFIRDDEAFQRTFIFLAPVFALALGAGTYWFLHRLVSSASIRPLIASVVAIYAFVTLGFAHLTVQRNLQESLELGTKQQNVLANYYQFRAYRPSRLAEVLAQAHGEHPGPILLVDALDPVSLSYYLLDQGLGSLALLDLRPTTEEERGTHFGLFQRAQEGVEELTFQGGNIHLVRELQESDWLTPTLAAAESWAPSGRYYLVTAYAQKNRELLRSLYPSLTLETLLESEGFSCIRISRE